MVYVTVESPHYAFPPFRERLQIFYASFSTSGLSYSRKWLADCEAEAEFFVLGHDAQTSTLSIR